MADSDGERFAKGEFLYMPVGEGVKAPQFVCLEDNGGPTALLRDEHGVTAFHPRRLLRADRRGKKLQPAPEIPTPGAWDEGHPDSAGRRPADG